MIAVVGGSGVGKSSLVYAGLLPQLEQEAAWRFVDMRPRGAPRIALAKAFIHLLTESHLITPEEADSSALVDHVYATLARSAFGLIDLTREWLPEDGKQLLLLVDQFEEIFRYEPKSSAGAIPAIEDEAAAFVALLLTAASADNVPVRVMLTMRADYIGDCIRFEGLPEAISGGQYLVPRLIREQLEAVIREPVIRAGATIDHDLVEQLLNDSAKESDALPVLQYALMRLWEQAGKQEDIAESGVRRLTMDLYGRIGRMSNALSLHADSVMEELTRSELGSRTELIVEQVMRALIEVDRQGRATRRPIPFGQLVCETGFGPPEIKQVIEAMRAETCSFLRPGPRDSLDDNTVIDVGHEALMRCWWRMAGPKKGWLVEEFRSDLRWRSLLVQAESFEGDSSNVLPPALTEQRAEWLKSRNTAWAERYGGGWERVQRLISASLEARKREKKRLWIMLLGGGALVIMIFSLITRILILEKRHQEQLKIAYQSSELLATKQQLRTTKQELNPLQQKVEDTVKTLQDAINKLANSKPDAAKALITKAERTLNAQIKKIEIETASDSSTTQVDGLRVYIQIANQSQRDKARELELQIEKQGIDGTKIIVPGIELISSFKGNSTLRCLRADECKAYGQKLVDVVNSFLQAPKVQLLDLSARYGQATNIRPWHYELWFGPGDIKLKDGSTTGPGK